MLLISQVGLVDFENWKCENVQIYTSVGDIDQILYLILPTYD
jgi:hypothetical protein